MTTQIAADPVIEAIVRRWRRFGEALERPQSALETEDVVTGLIDRSLLQQELDAGKELTPDELVQVDRTDRALRRAAPLLIDRTNVGLFRDDEPLTHWWWHLEEIVLGRGSSTLLDVPAAAKTKGVHPHTIRSAVKQGLLPARRLARGFLIHRRDLERWQPRAVGRPRTSPVGKTDTLVDAFNDANLGGDLARAYDVAVAIAAAPSTPRRRLALAIDAYNRRDFEDARRWSAEALDRDLPPASRQTAQLVLGRSLLNLGLTRDALRVLESTPAEGEHGWLVTAAVVESLLALNRFKRATKLARLLAATATGIPEAKFLLARAEWHTSDVWEALEHIIQYRMAAPEDSEGRILHGVILGYLGDQTSNRDLHRAALALFREAGPDETTRLLRLEAMTLARIGDWREALRATERLAAESKDDPDEREHVTGHLVEAILDGRKDDDPEVGLRVVRRAERSFGPSAYLARLLASELASTGDIEGVLHSLGIARDEVERASPVDQRLIATALLVAGEAGEALPILRRTMPDPPSTGSLILLAQTALANDDIGTAREALEQIAMGEDPAAPVAGVSLEILSRAGKERRPEAFKQLAAMFAPTEAAAPGPLVGRPAPETRWEGLHPPVSGVVERATSARLH